MKQQTKTSGQLTNYGVTGHAEPNDGIMTNKPEQGSEPEPLRSPIEERKYQEQQRKGSQTLSAYEKQKLDRLQMLKENGSLLSQAEWRQLTELMVKAGLINPDEIQEED